MTLSWNSKIITTIFLLIWVMVTRHIVMKLVPNAQEIVKVQGEIQLETKLKNPTKVELHEHSLFGRDEASLFATTTPPLRKTNCKTAKHKCSYDIHIFYYGWYGNPTYDQKWLHWNHPRLPHWNKQTAKRFSQKRHIPEKNDIGSIYYPSLGFYSSHDPSVIENHMEQIQRAGAGVLAVSWYPPNQHDNEGRASDMLIPALLDAASKYGLRITFHIEPYKKRSPESVKSDLKYIIDTYGKHPGFYVEEKSQLPMIYVYDSYLISPKSWSTILKKDGKNSIRNTKYDCLMIGLLVEHEHKSKIEDGHWDGFYTYFAVDGMTYGSTFINFHSLRVFADKNNLIYIPSVGPGYNDIPVRPWNRQNIRDRQDGRYYKKALGYAKRNTEQFISITSFNEWHEGTQIERASRNEKREDLSGEMYKDYGTYGEYYYLDLTREILFRFVK